jgi:hypothetical protein
MKENRAYLGRAVAWLVASVDGVPSQVRSCVIFDAVITKVFSEYFGFLYPFFFPTAIPHLLIIVSSDTI